MVPDTLSASSDTELEGYFFCSMALRRISGDIQSVLSTSKPSLFSTTALASFFIFCGVVPTARLPLTTLFSAGDPLMRMPRPETVLLIIRTLRQENA